MILNIDCAFVKDRNKWPLNGTMGDDAVLSADRALVGATGV